MRKRRLRAIVITLLLTGLAIAGAIVRPRAASGLDREFTQEERQFWSLQKVVAVSPPAVRDRRWVRPPIDAFIVHALEAKRIAPAPRADRITLLRRAYL